MRNRASIPQESVNKITQLLQENTKVKEIAQQTGVNVHQIYHLRTKLSRVGVIKTAKRKTRTSRATKTAQPTTTTTVANAPVVATKTKTVAQPTNNNARSYEFNVNGMKVTVSGAREVAFTNGSIDIKY